MFSHLPITDRHISTFKVGEWAYYKAHSLCRCGSMVRFTVPIMSGYPLVMLPKTTNLRFSSFSSAALAVEIKERSWSVSSYRFGFNGKEKDSETFDGAIAFEARIYDSRIGRFFSSDPREAEYAWQSTNAYFANCPIAIIDHLGMGGESRHKDKDGNLIAEYDDGNDGVYYHQTAKTKKDVDYWRSKYGVGGGGVKVGEYTKYQLFDVDYGNNKSLVEVIEFIDNDKLASFNKRYPSDKLIKQVGTLKETEDVPIDNNKEKNVEFTIDDAGIGLKKVYDNYGPEMCEIVEKMYRLETNHFTSKQFRLTGSGGMEAFGSAPFYGWHSDFWKNNPVLAPIGLTSLYENKGASGIGGNAQVTDKPKQFIVFPSVSAAMHYKVDYINRYNGNYARWYNTNSEQQEIYKNSLKNIKPRITNKISR